MNNACTELERAVLILATSKDSLQERLAEAWTKIMSFDMSTNHDTSELITSEVKSLERKILANGGTIQDACSKMTDDKCRDYIGQVVTIYGKAIEEVR